jgi:hypothetical protein
VLIFISLSVLGGAATPLKTAIVVTDFKIESQVNNISVVAVGLVQMLVYYAES